MDAMQAMAQQGGPPPGMPPGMPGMGGPPPGMGGPPGMPPMGPQMMPPSMPPMGGMMGKGGGNFQAMVQMAGQLLDLALQSADPSTEGADKAAAASMMLKGLSAGASGAMPPQGPPGLGAGPMAGGPLQHSAMMPNVAPPMSPMDGAGMPPGMPGMGGGMTGMGM